MMALYKYPNMVKVEQNPDHSTCPLIAIRCSCPVAKSSMDVAQYGELATSQIIGLRRIAHTILSNNLKSKSIQVSQV